MKRHFILAILALASVSAQAASESPFYLPVRNNDLGTIRNLLRDPGPKTRDARGNSPVMYAAALGSMDALRLMVEAGADVNAPNDFGATPLMWCAGDLAKVRYLLSRGANVNARSKLGRSPLMIAAAYDGSIETVRLMIEKGADVKAQEESGMTVLESAAASNNLEVARLLLEKGADVNVVDKGGITALLVAAWNGNRNGAMVKLLLAHGAKPNVPTSDAFEMVKNGPLQLGHLTALQLAAGMGGYEAVESLVRAGADVNAKDVRNATPLVFAVATDHADLRIVRLLLDKGADRAPALPWARRYQNPEVLSALHLQPEKPAPVTPAVSARWEIREAIAKALAVSQPAAQKFLAAGGCLGCHAEHLNGLAVAAAKPTGAKADFALEESEARATATLRGSIEQALFQVQDPAAGVDSQQFSLMQMAGSGLRPSLATDSLLHHIAALQRKEGDWPNYGVVRPPLEDGGFSHTAKGIRALRLYPIAGRKAEFDERVARAATWLEKAEPVSTEDRAMQLLGIAWAGRKAPAERVKQLVSRQQPDGGWGQTSRLATDAYATGEALWALHEAGMPATDTVYRRGVDYLLRTQQADGSWHVVTRAFAFQPYFESGFPHGRDQWISQSGTAMAVIGLSYAVPR
jgi:ankyrin repeat protein